MSDTPNNDLHSEAADLRARFSLLRTFSTDRANLDQHIARREWRKAQSLGKAMGLPVSTHVVISLEQARAARR